LLFLVVATAIAAPAQAWASDGAASNERAIAAKVLLDEALDLMDHEAHLQACPKLEESARLVETLGATFHLAQCYELTQRFASAWHFFGRAETIAARASNNEAAKTCHDRRARLEPKLGRIEIVVPEAHRVAGLRITRGSLDVGRLFWSGAGVPSDQGAVAIDASAPGHVSWTQSVRVENGAVARVLVPALAKVPDLAGDAVTNGDRAGARTPPAVTPKPRQPMRALAWAFGGGALAGLGVAIAGIVAREGVVSRYNADATCLGTASAADPETCKKLRADGATFQTVGTIGLVAAGTLAATSAVFFVLSSPAQEARTSLACGPLLGGATCALRF
jgi:serine/threonine-protein kinase